jgi:aspartyl-tRNA(Asn)/glutamyl-tRNA(Gln) amidotransferase subunit C
MSISRAQVEKIALLSRLLLTSAELDEMTANLGGILDYMEQLSEVDTENVEPMAHAGDVTSVYREDRVEPSLSRDEALANAPHRDHECYLVPAVLGEA